MLNYTDIPASKKAFIFELDNVLYPEKDYLLQVYYLFANFLEYTEAFPVAADLTAFLKKSYLHHGPQEIFERAEEVFGIDKKYGENFLKLHKTAKLPLKLLLYDNVLKLLQSITIDRKQIFLVVNGDPEQQLNKIRQLEWNGLEQCLTVYFAAEWRPKPETDVLEYILEKHSLFRKEMVIIGRGAVDEEFAAASGIDYIEIADLL